MLLKKETDKNDRTVNDILENLRPTINRMIHDTPDWGSIGLTLIFHGKEIRRVETSLNTSVLCK
jgi:hypothetical protein